MSTHTITRAGLVAAAALVTMVAGCGGGPSAEPADRAGSHSPSSSSPGSPSATASPSASARPSGQLAAITHASITLPKSWTIHSATAQSITFWDNKRSMPSEFGESGGWPSDERPTKKNIAESAREALTDHPPNWRRLPDLVVNGVRLYHLRGVEGGSWNDEYGTFTHGYLITVGFDHDTVFAPRTWQIKQMTKVMKTFRLR